MLKLYDIIIATALMFCSNYFVVPRELLGYVTVASFSGFLYAYILVVCREKMKKYVNG